MGRDLPARVQLDIGQEAFVAADQAAGHEGGWKAHGRATYTAHDAVDKERRTMPNPTAAMLVIGDEILSGRTRDANMHYLAGRTDPPRHRPARGARGGRRSRPPSSPRCGRCRDRYDHVFTSGGIGPTHDDITADAVAAAFGAAIDVRDDARALLQAHYDRQGIELNEARLRMARIPDGATLIDNPVSAAPGFTLGNVHVMAGVPPIFEAMVA